MKILLVIISLSLCINSEGKERLEKKVLKCVRSYIPLNFVPEVYSKPGCMLELPGKFKNFHDIYFQHYDRLPIMKILL